MSNALGTVATVVAVSWFLNFVIKRTKQPIAKASADAPVVLKMDRSLIWLGIGATVVPIVAFLALVLIHPPGADSEFWAKLDAQHRPDWSFWGIMGIAGFFSTLGILILWGSQGFIEVSDRGIKYMRVWMPWRRKRLDEITWNEIRELTFKGAGFYLYTTSGKKYGVPVGLTGLIEFLRYCERHIPAAAREKAKDGYKYLGEPFPGEL